MNMNKDILLYFALLLWFVVPVSAQPTIFAPTETVESGTSISVDIRIVDFEDIQSMQFSVNWNPTVLQFDSIHNLGALPDYSAANFGTNSAQSGKLTTLWLDSQLLGVSLEDSTVLFSIVFDVIGAPDSLSIVAITDDPTMIEISDLNGNVLPVNIENGMIVVAGIVSVNSLGSIRSNELFTLYQNEPNPFDNQTIIRFDLNQSNEVEFYFYDIKGKLIYSFKNYFLEGENSITINADKLPGSGTYFYSMQTNDYSITNKMILIR
jgi:Secretion system C-terminal sorting domain/Cohesin domain